MSPKFNISTIFIGHTLFHLRNYHWTVSTKKFSHILQAAVPAPSGGYPQRTVGASQPDEDLIAGVTAAFDSAHGPGTITTADRLAAASTSTFTEQQYRNMVSILTFLLFFISTGIIGSFIHNRLIIYSYVY